MGNDDEVCPPEGFVICSKHGIGHHRKYDCMVCLGEGEENEQLEWDDPRLQSEEAE